MGTNITTTGQIMGTLIEAEGKIDRDLEKDLGIGIITHPEPGPPADREGTTQGRTKIGPPLIGTPDSIMKMRPETHPEGKTDMRKDTVTLAMVGIAEDAARRPCFMGGLL